jgi:hypothetical protein
MIRSQVRFTVATGSGTFVNLRNRSSAEVQPKHCSAEAGDVYGAMDMGWAKLVGQIAQAYGE